MPDNATLAEEAAEAVNPNGTLQKGILARTGHSPGMSYADRLMGKQDGLTETDNSFFAGLNKANNAKLVTEGVPAEELGEQSAAPAPAGEPVTPAPPRKLTDPPVAPKQRSNFRILERERDELRARLKVLESGSQSQPALGSPVPPTAASSSPPPAEVLALTKEVEGLKGELELLDITRSPSFQSEFELPRTSNIRQAKNMAGTKGAEVEAVLSMTFGPLRDQLLAEAVKDLPESSARLINHINDKLIALESDKVTKIDIMRATAGERFKQRELVQQRDALVRKAEFDALASEWGSAVDAFNPTKDKAASTRLEEARSYYDGSKLSHKERAAVALQAALVPTLMAENEELSAELERLQTSLTRFTGGLPGGGGTPSDPETPAPANTPEQRDRDFQARLKQTLRSDPTFGDVRRHRGIY